MANHYLSTLNDKGIIFLSGGGDEKKSWVIDQKFVSILKTKKILYIPVALNRDFLGFEEAYDWVVSCLSSHSKEFLEIIMNLDLNKITDEDLNHFEAVYIGGGNTYKLLYLFKISKFEIKLKKFYENGGIIYGGSAGAIVLGKNIATVEEEKKENNGKCLFEEGLNLLNNYSIICHFNPEEKLRIEKIKNFIKKFKIPVLALPEGSGLIKKQERFYLIDKDKPVFKFDLKGKFFLINDESFY